MPRADVAAAYDTRADEYVERLGSVDQMAPQDRETIGSWRDRVTGRLLDAGCGPGHWSDLLGAGGREVIGVDGSAAFLASARQRFPHVPFAQGDLAALPLETSSVDGVLAWYSLIHTPPADLPAVVSELARVLVPGGSLLLGFFDGDPGEPFDHTVVTAYWWSAEALGELLGQRGFVVERSGTRREGVKRPHGDLTATLAP